MLAVAGPRQVSDMGARGSTCIVPLNMEGMLLFVTSPWRSCRVTSACSRWKQVQAQLLPGGGESDTLGWEGSRLHCSSRCGIEKSHAAITANTICHNQQKARIRWQDRSQAFTKCLPTACTYLAAAPRSANELLPLALLSNSGLLLAQSLDHQGLSASPRLGVTHFLSHQGQGTLFSYYKFTPSLLLASYAVCSTLLTFFSLCYTHASSYFHVIVYDAPISQIAPCLSFH